MLSTFACLWRGYLEEHPCVLPVIFLLMRRHSRGGGLLRAGFWLCMCFLLGSVCVCWGGGLRDWDAGVKWGGGRHLVYGLVGPDVCHRLCRCFPWCLMVIAGVRFIWVKEAASVKEQRWRAKTYASVFNWVFKGSIKNIMHVYISFICLLTVVYSK